jgi:hypothetical protein
MSMDEVRQLWRSGVLDRDSLYWEQGMADWQPVEALTAGAGSRALQTAPANKPLAPVTPSLALPPGVASTSGLAIASAVLGATGLMIGITAIPAIICGHMARREIRLSQNRLEGDGLAIAGLVMGYIVTGVVALFIVIPLLLVLILAVFAAANGG